MAATEWGRNTRIGRRESEREKEREAQCERAGLFQGEKNHTTEGESIGIRRRGTWATVPPLERLDRGRAAGSSATGRP